MRNYIVTSGEEKVLDKNRVFIEVQGDATNLKTAISLAIKSGRVLDIYKKVNWEPKEI